MSLSFLLREKNTPFYEREDRKLCLLTDYTSSLLYFLKGGSFKMLERDFQAKLIKELKQMFPGCIVPSFLPCNVDSLCLHIYCRIRVRQSLWYIFIGCWVRFAAVRWRRPRRFFFCACLSIRAGACGQRKGLCPRQRKCNHRLFAAETVDSWFW